MTDWQLVALGAIGGAAAVVVLLLIVSWSIDDEEGSGW